MTYHRFPKEKERMKEWIIKIRRDEDPKFQVRLELCTCTVHVPRRCTRINIRYD
jgi:THAP domain